MGSYTDLSINGYPILTTKSYVIPEIMTLFQESDKHITSRKISERNELVWGNVSSDQDYEEVAVMYRCEVGKVIDRLNVMGFTMRRVRKEFENVVKSEAEKYTEWVNKDNEDLFFNDLNYFTNLTFEQYAQAFRTVLTQPIDSELFSKLDTNLDSITKRIHCNNEHYFLTFRSLIRLACDLVPKTSFVVQDITEIVHAGYYEENEPVCANSIQDLTQGYPENSARIILTEGSTDVEILQNSLELLYPHLFGYYTFLDFKSGRPQGGAGSLVTTVKAFAASGISNRIIAIFDNDTAAFEARRSLKSITLPQNIAVCNYPDLSSLEAYPTLGPGGLALLNINGLAASIELYLGSDVLKNGKEFPIQWKGYVESLGQYQGEVMHKQHLQELFRKKLERCKSSTDEFSRSDWSGLKAILEVIFHIFD